MWRKAVYYDRPITFRLALPLGTSADARKVCHAERRGLHGRLALAIAGRPRGFAVNRIQHILLRGAAFG